MTLKETLYFLAVYEYTRDRLFNPSPIIIKDPDGENLWEQDLVPPPFPSYDVREVSIATSCLGDSVPRASPCLPGCSRDASQCYLVNFPLGHYPRNNRGAPQVSPWNTDVSALLHRWALVVFRSSSGLCLTIETAKTHPLPHELRFLELFMRKFLGVGFRLDLFGSGEVKYFRED
ncbi:hypothetical protein V8F20_002607 [Naviculisporaceae sp. PSN 640]